VKPLLATIFLAVSAHSAHSADTDTKTLRVFIFAGQSNMVGTHSRVKDIHRFPPFAVRVRGVRHKLLIFNPNPAIEKSRFAREG
jgi:hypothetical protein